MLRTIKLVGLLSIISTVAFAQIKPTLNSKPGTNAAQPVKVTPKLNPVPALPAPKPQAAPTMPAMKKINANLEYVFMVDKPTSPKPKEGDQIKVHLLSVVNNRLMFNSRATNKNKPIEFGINKPAFKGDIIEAITLMTPGDSMICMADADAVFSNSKTKKPDFIKKGDKVFYFIKLVSVKTKEEVQKEQQAAFQKQIREQMDKQLKEEAKIAAKEEKELQAYFTKNNINPLKTPLGTYYTINEKGDGAIPKTGDTVVMNYTGKLMDGTKFDSNEDTTFHHVQPFEFPLGANRVIKGWDETIGFLPLNSKATFYIPSRNGYGSQGQAKIPANSILIFDVQLNNIKPKIETPKTETK
jgi:FKBP-type peptidyl-prolyl cis-trans isomerase